MHGPLPFKIENHFCPFTHMVKICGNQVTSTTSVPTLPCISFCTYMYTTNIDTNSLLAQILLVFVWSQVIGTFNLSNIILYPCPWQGQKILSLCEQNILKGMYFEWLYIHSAIQIPTRHKNLAENPNKIMREAINYASMPVTNPFWLATFYNFLVGQLPELP